MAGPVQKLHGHAASRTCSARTVKMRSCRRLLSTARALPPYRGPAPKPYTGPSADEVLALRKQFLNPAMFLYYKKPIMVVEGHGAYLFGASVCVYCLEVSVSNSTRLV